MRLQRRSMRLCRPRVPDLPFGSEPLAKRLEGDAVSVEMLRSVELLAVSRAAVGFRFTTPTDALGHEVWLVLSLSTAVPAVVAATPFLGLELLFTGPRRQRPHEDPDRPGKAIPTYEDPANPEGLDWRWKACCEAFWSVPG